jgi:hypothetical protein
MKTPAFFWYTYPPEVAGNCHLNELVMVSCPVGVWQTSAAESGKSGANQSGGALSGQFSMFIALGMAVAQGETTICQTNRRRLFPRERFKRCIRA